MGIPEGHTANNQLQLKISIEKGAHRFALEFTQHCYHRVRECLVDATTNAHSPTYIDLLAEVGPKTAAKTRFIVPDVDVINALSRTASQLVALLIPLIPHFSLHQLDQRCGWL